MQQCNLYRRDFLKLTGCAMAATFLPFISSYRSIGNVGIHIIPDKRIRDLLIPGTNVQLLASWMDIEKSQGTYDWTSLDNTFELVKDYPIIFGVHRVPDWARQLPEYAGSKIKDEHISNFYDFCDALCSRYYPQGLELWNEPDVSPENVPADLRLHIGAWGETYTEGQYWGQIFEGLHRRLVGLTQLRGPACIHPKDFFYGAIDYCKDHNCLPDVLTFHQYQSYWNSYLDALWHDADIVHSKYNVPVCLSETNLVFKYEPPPIDFEDRQEEYFRKLSDTQPDWGSYQVYNLLDPEWNNAFLVDWGGYKRKAYYIYEQAVRNQFSV